MPTPNLTLRQRLEFLADDVESSTPSAAERLRDLGAAVEGEPGADIWAAANIFQVIDPDTIADQVRHHGGGDAGLRFLEVLRNVLVFMPIVVTWIGIWLALESYGAAIQAEPALAEQSFLFLWQQGFGGRIWLTLSRIALIDGMLLGLVAVLTLFVMSRNNQKDREADHVRDDLAGVLADASLALTARRTRQTAGFVYEFDRIAQELLGEVRQERLRIQDIADRKQAELGDLSAFTRDFMTGTQGMLAAAHSLHQVPLQLGRILSSLSTAFQQLADQQKDQQHDLSVTMRHAASQLRLLTDSYRVSSLDMQGMGTNLQSTGADLQAVLAELREAVKTFQQSATQNAQAVTDIRATTGDLAAAQAQFQSALTFEHRVIEKWTQELHAVVESLQRVSRLLDNVPPGAGR